MPQMSTNHDLSGNDTMKNIKEVPSKYIQFITHDTTL